MTLPYPATIHNVLDKSLRRYTVQMPWPGTPFQQVRPGRRPSNGRERHPSKVVRGHHRNNGWARHPSQIDQRYHPSNGRERHPGKVDRGCHLSNSQGRRPSNIRQETPLAATKRGTESITTSFTSLAKGTPAATVRDITAERKLPTSPTGGITLSLTSSGTLAPWPRNCTLQQSLRSSSHYSTHHYGQASPETFFLVHQAAFFSCLAEPQ